MEANEVTAAELDEVEALDKAATPGPWAVERDSGDSTADGNGAPWPHRVLASCGATVVDFTGGVTDADAELIAAARTVLPRFTRALRRHHGDEQCRTWEAVQAEQERAYKAAYDKGRRDATSGACALLRGPYEAMAKYTRGEDFDSIRERAAVTIERHEAESRRSKS